MARRITIIQGHPDPAGGHLCHALADAYESGAVAAGHQVRRVEVAQLDFPLLRRQREFDAGEPPEGITAAQQAIEWAEHLVIVYPLWLGTMPALLKAFFEQTLRPGFVFGAKVRGRPQKRLKGRSARIVVTMGMPAFVYRWYFAAHSLRSLERNILKFCGVAPVRTRLFGMAGGAGERRSERWLAGMRVLGGKGR